MKYTIEYRCWAKAEIEAESIDEALDMADERWYNAFVDDKTGFEMIYGEPYCVVWDNGKNVEYIDY